MSLLDDKQLDLDIDTVDTAQLQLIHAYSSSPTAFSEYLRQKLTKEIVLHQAKSGVNPLVDAAGYLFSRMGKLHTVMSVDFQQLQASILREIAQFLEHIKQEAYPSEYALVARYILCVSFDDIILHAPWGQESFWQKHSLLTVFHQENISEERFYLILERLMKAPVNHIDMMEFMYVCLSLGFKGNLRTNAQSHHDLEHITNALYQSIRAVRGDFIRALSPYPLRLAHQTKSVQPHFPGWLIILLTLSFCALVIISFYLLITLTTHFVYTDITRMGNLQSYETNTPLSYSNSL
jgi:type VI secretion system protein ImpK